MECAIGVDLGGTHLRAALIDKTGTLVSHQRVLTNAHEGADAVLERMVVMIKLLAQEYPQATIHGVGIAAPGPLDPVAGVVLTTPNMPGWDHFPLRQRVEAHVPWPVFIGNDANLAAMGEWLFGTGRGLKNVIYVTISTGIGGGIISDGRLLLGHRGLAAEIGHLVVSLDAPEIEGVPVRGSWESLASGTALARDAASALRNGVPTLLASLASPETVSPLHIEQAARQGDPFAQQLIAQAGRWCGIAFVSLLHLFSPEVIVIGGGVSNLGDALLNPARQEIAERALPPYREVPLVLTTLGDSLGLLGAAAVVFNATQGA